MLLKGFIIKTKKIIKDTNNQNLGSENKLFNRNDIINNGTVTTLLKKNIHHAIIRHFSNENINNTYSNFKLETNVANYNFYHADLYIFADHNSSP